MTERPIDALLAQLRATAALAAGAPPERAAPAAAAAPAGVDFAALLKSSLDQVNESQAKAMGLARDFELGKGDVALHDVMLALQKANIEFQGTVQVRNRLVAAYQDIMNMQI